MKFHLQLLITLEMLVNAGKHNTDYINKTETKLSRMMMSTFFIKSIYGGIRLLVNIYKPRKRSIRYFPPDLVVEESYDARIAHPYCGTIETIMEQGNCWSCWAVAVATTFSDRICIHSGGELQYHMSAQQLLACNRQNNGCWGGEIYTAWKFLEEFPLVTGGPYGSTGAQRGCQPFLINDEKPDKLKCSREYCPVTHKAKDVITLPQNEYEIRREIQYYGPVSAMMTLYESLFHYRKGVYEKKRNDSFVSPHFVRIIGWGVTTDTRKLKYWIVADSLSPTWGEKGTFRILRGSNHCGIESRVIAGLPDFYSP